MIQRGYRALVLWIAWSAVAIVIYAGMYNDTEVMEFVQHDQTRISWAILALFGVGVLTSFVLTVLLTFESIKVDQLEHIAKDKGWMGIERFKKRLSIANFFDALHIILKNNGSFNIEALVQVEFAIYQRTAHGLEVIGNLLITLGLVGTVVGLTLTLTGLTSSLEALGQDQEQMLRGLRTAMGGMGTAFYTTLLGSVLGGVLLRVFAHINENGVEVLENGLTRICLVYCAADLNPSSARDARVLNMEIEQLTNNINRLQSIIQQTRETLKDFSSDIQSFRGDEREYQHLLKLLPLRKQYLASLRDEFQLQRLNKGLLWRALLRGFRRD